MPGLRATDQTSGAGAPDVRAWQIEAPVLIDPEHPIEYRVARALEVLVEVTIHADRGRLHERLVGGRAARHVGADRPRLVLPEGDAGRSQRIEVVNRVVLSRLGGGFPELDDLGVAGPVHP